MDQIKIERLQVYAYHGVFPEENKVGQVFLLNATLWLDCKRAAKGDELEYSTHYGEVCEFMKKYMQENTYKLIETLAYKMAREILLNFPNLEAIELEVEKPEAPIPIPFKTVKVCIWQGWHQVFIAYGSNLGDKNGFVDAGLKRLGEHPDIQMVACSGKLITKPYGGIEQDDFVNGVVEIKTLLDPEELLEFLHVIEQEQQRERVVRWGPRTLDLDIIFYEKRVYESKQLVIPHVDMENRDFVLKPLVEIAPNFRHPILQKTMTQLLQALEGKGENYA